MTGKDLVALGACAEAVEWLGDRTVEEVWGGCDRGDWMWWLVTRLHWGLATGDKYRQLRNRAMSCWAAEGVPYRAHLAAVIRSVFPEVPCPPPKP